ncbi:hypothetical protein W97_09041 [Coniosporium apollinis CBS 100218]|uniref:Uncharacterized protein n=1 Tax=Coniosporium apollinis (strain CBS 100218) TaxID=1168221 RepID=R7Z6P6_CONA1|nr:uncharacterized protein W97_09041 [Coniosporium apollinis CBS 100218]EON69778.1 hypothetical protein W97_09041 [Coniosporium apollinis CBS 100218]
MGSNNVSNFEESLKNIFSGVGFDSSALGGLDLDYNRLGWVNSTWWLEPLYNNASATLESIEKTVAGVAMAMTNRIRMGGTNYWRQRSVPALGAIHQTTTCVRFDWKWLLLPALLVALSILLLCATIVQTVQHARQQVWKSSPLPLLFHGLSSDVRQGCERVPRLDEMNVVAEETRVRLRRIENG